MTRTSSPSVIGSTANTESTSQAGHAQLIQQPAQQPARLEVLKGGVEVDLNSKSHAGQLTKVVYQKAGSDFVILKIGGVDCIGMMSAPQMSAQYTLEGDFVENKKFNTWNFKFKKYEAKIDASAGLRELLIRECPYLGPTKASRLVTLFRDETLKVLAEQPEKVRANISISYDRIMEMQVWAKGIAKNAHVKEKLYGIGLTPALVEKLISHFGSDAAKKIKEDCFQLIGIPGIGFKTADNISNMLGIPHDNPGRVKAAILYCMECLTDQGHTCIPRTDLVRDVCRVAVIDQTAADKIIEELISEERLLTEQNKIAEYAVKVGRVLV